MTADQQRFRTIKDLRQLTAAPTSLCAEALAACQQDFSKALAYIRDKQKQAEPAPSKKQRRTLPTVNHAALGELSPETSRMPSLDGWHTTVVLPAFQSCYERWNSDGSEVPDRRHDDRCRGHFPVWIPAPFVDGLGAQQTPSLPSESQVAAFRYLVENQAVLASAIFTALLEDLPKELPWLLEDALKNKIATAEGMMGAVELQQICIYRQAEGGCAFTGFGFHSELLEPEHGIGVVMWREEVEALGQTDVLFEYD